LIFLFFFSLKIIRIDTGWFQYLDRRGEEGKKTI
jgi:hypothetical protein